MLRILRLNNVITNSAISILNRKLLSEIILLPGAEKYVKQVLRFTPI